MEVSRQGLKYITYLIALFVFCPLYLLFIVCLFEWMNGMNVFACARARARALFFFIDADQYLAIRL